MHTEHTIMSKLEKIRVHIAPLGFEVDRIVLPARKMKADKVWIIQEIKPEKEIAKPYRVEILKKLKKERIQTEIFETDRKDVFKILKSVKEIFNREKKNDIFVNVSSGSKIQSIACMMACMMFSKYNATPYYAEPEKYPATFGKPQSSGLKNLIELPQYEIRTPKIELVKALNIIKQHNGRITKKEMATLAQENKLITITAREENLEQARYASLETNIIQPLSEQWNFVEIEKIGRTRWIKLTEEGFNAIEFLL